MATCFTMDASSLTRSWRIAAAASVVFVIVFLLWNTPKSAVGLAGSIAIAVDVRVAAELALNGRTTQFSEVRRMGRPLGTFALVTAAATAAIEAFARDVPLLVVAFDAVFAGVLLLALDSILRQVPRKRRVCHVHPRQSSGVQVFLEKSDLACHLWRASDPLQRLR
jgi:hypothetical protein